MLVRTIRMLAWGWLVAACFLILVAYASVWRQRGVSALWEFLGPHNLTNILAVGLTLAPTFFLYQLAGSLREKKRRKILGWAAATVVTVTAVLVLLLLPLTMAQNEAKHAREHGKAREYEAQAIRVKDRSATLYRYSDHRMSTVSDPDGSVEIPEAIQLGDTITVNGQRIRANHILVKEIQADMQYGGKLLGRAGDTQCVIAETLENMPDNNASSTSERLWIIVEDCAPLAIPAQEGVQRSNGQVHS